MVNTKAILGLIVVLAIALLLAAYLGAFHSQQGNPRNSTSLASSASTPLSIWLTDPPQVPAGTDSLFINYSSIAVHASGAQGSGWVEAQGNGTINILSLINLSQTIGSASIPKGSSINLARFNITSARITINGTTYPITVPSGIVTARVQSGNTTNASRSLLLSLSPSVVTIMTSNTTIFVLVPSAAAVILPGGTNQSTLRAGYKARTSAETSGRLETASPNMTITSVSLAVASNVTAMRLSVTNNGNSTIVLRHISIRGEINSTLNASAIADGLAVQEDGLRSQILNSSACANLTSTSNLTASIKDRPSSSADAGLGIGLNSSLSSNSTQSNTEAAGNASESQGANQSAGGSNENASQDKGRTANAQDFGSIGDAIGSEYGLRINRSVCTAAGFSEFQNEAIGAAINTSRNFGKMQASLRQMTFLISANGTLDLPYSVEDFNATGYQLLPGHSVTFTYDAVIATRGGRVVMTPAAGRSYSVSIIGEDEAYAAINVTAT